VTTERAAELEALNQEVRVCPLCDLAKTRTKAVPGEGPVDAEIMFIGEGPGFNEDRQGRPFVGQAGQLLVELLASIGLQRTEVYITNVVKCRPPENRDPFPYEIAACAPYLDRQLRIINPRVVVTLGRYSMAKFFPGVTISRIHGQPKRADGRIYYPMIHPAAALRRPESMTALKADTLRIPDLLVEARAMAASGEGAGAPAVEEAPKQLGLFDF